MADLSSLPIATQPLSRDILLELLGPDATPWTKNGDDIYYSSGKVGIGNSSPGQLLDILGSSPYIKITDLGNQGRYVQLGTYNEGAWWILSTTQSDLVLATGNTGFNIRFRAGGADAVIIDGDGRMGIGTNSPTAKLHVVGLAQYADNAAAVAAGLTAGAFYLNPSNQVSAVV